MERSVTAEEARKAAQQQTARGLDAMLLAIGGAKKVRPAFPPLPPLSCSPLRLCPVAVGEAKRARLRADPFPLSRVYFLCDSVCVMPAPGRPSSSTAVWGLPGRRPRLTDTAECLRHQVNVPDKSCTDRAALLANKGVCILPGMCALFFKNKALSHFSCAAPGERAGQVAVGLGRGEEGL